MELVKSYWTSSGDSINLNVPFVKVDKERRIVSGFATLDNVDKHGDIVDTAASMQAFTRFRGNIREMHQPVAVGKVVSFKQQDFYDSKTKKNYSGVFVDVYVSKGAQDTWEKVLDGTLSGFSIGGSINKADTVHAHDDYEGPVRIIKDYDLVELSLVDNPANQFANVFSIQKADIGFTVTGMATEVKAVNVFYCDADGIAVTSSGDQNECSACNSTMKNIGWVEEASDQKSAVADLVDSYIKKNTKGEGGIEKMSDELQNEAVEPEVEASEVEVVEEPVAEDEVIEKSVDGEPEAPAEETSEPAAEEAPESVEPDFEKMLDGIKAYVADAIAKAADNTPSVEDVIGQMMANINKSMEDMAAKQDAVAKSVENLSGALEEMRNRMDSYESSTAVKKSNDLESESFGTVRKSESIWKGHFLGVQNL